MAALDFSSRSTVGGAAPAPLDFSSRAAPEESAAFKKGKAASKDGLSGAIAGGLATVYEAIPGADEASAWLNAKIHTGSDLLTGKQHLDPKDPRGSLKAIEDQSWRDARDEQAGLMTGFREDHPVYSNLATGAGYAAQTVPMLMTGGASAAPEVVTAARGLGARVAKAAVGTARNAVTGATVAAGNAMTGRGSVAERVRAADAAIPAGAVAGVVVPAAIDTVGAVANKVGEAAGAIARTGVRSVNKMAAAGPDGAFLDPHQQVLSRLSETLQKDGLAPEQITAALDEWNRVGGASPSFMDIIAKNGGGQNTMALIRGAAMSGQGRNEASQYGARVAADLQDSAISRTAALTPDESRPAGDVAAALRGERSDVATKTYAEPYKAPVPLNEDVTSVLTDAPGQAALRHARADAVERRDAARVAEIDSLLGKEPPAEVSAATLDRAQIAMRERADKLDRQGNNARAGGARDRRAVINTTLDNVPELGPARAAYRDYSQGIEGVEKTGPRLMTAAPDEYAGSVAKYGDRGMTGAKIGARQTITDAIGRPAEGATGVLNRLSSSTNTSRNLATTFGEEPAADYQSSIRNMVDQVNNARFINPNTGSGTAGRLADEQLVESIPTSKAGVVRWIIDKFRAGSTLTDEERALLVRMATGRAENVTPTILPSMTGPAPARLAPRARVSPVAVGAMTGGQRRGSVSVSIDGRPESGSSAR